MRAFTLLSTLSYLPFFALFVFSFSVVFFFGGGGDELLLFRLFYFFTLS